MFYYFNHFLDNNDISDIGVVETDNDGRAVFTVTANDDRVLESIEAVRLKFTALYTLFTEKLESVGEYIRDMAYVHITDNDGESDVLIGWLEHCNTFHLR